MKKLIAIALVLAATGCRQDASIFLTGGANQDTPATLQGARDLARLCPGLIDAKHRLAVIKADEKAHSGDIEREFGTRQFVRYQVEVKAPQQGQPYDVGEICSYDVAIGAGMITAKTACARLCDGSEDKPYLVKKL